MKTLGAWIAGIFALGLALGAFVSNSSAVPELAASDIGDAIEAVPAVDCGEGREALYEPIVVDGKSSFKIRCVATETGEPRRETIVVTQPAPVATAPSATTRAPAPPAPQSAEAEIAVEDPDDSRTWKESAVIIGGAAGAGAGVGAIAKGKKGAAVGAAIGAASGAAYELIKRDKKN